MAKIDDAIQRMLAYPDAFALSDKRWSDADFEAAVSATKLSIEGELKTALRDYGYVERETELYFRGTFLDGSQEIGEIQILFSSSDRVIQDYKNMNADPAYPNRGVANYVPFGTADGGRSFLFADGRNSGDDAVYYWPIAFDAIGQGDNARGVAKVADTLAEFIDGLKPRDEI